jgi:streptogramin lyase
LVAGSTGLSDSLGAYVLSGSYGQFTITGDYTCPTPTTQVYLYAVGGNVGSGVNASAGFLEALGPCGNLTPSTSVYVDEVTTVAAAYALAGFATDATHIGSSATALAQTGIVHAFATVNNLVNAGSGAAYATTPAGNGTVPQTEINALANSLAGCVNSTGAGFTQCTTLFKNATNDGVTCTTPPCADQPTDTASAAINIAHFPSKNVATIFGLAAGVGTPFLPALSAAPANWTIGLSFTGAGLTGMYTEPQGLVVDGSGNLWAASGLGTVLSEFSSLGVAANASGYTGLNLSTPNGLSMDANSTHVWIANFDNNNVITFTISSSSGAAHSTGAGSGPGAVDIDGSGNAWVANISANNVLRMNSSGTILSTLTGNGINFPGQIAFEPGAAGNTWVTEGSGGFNASLFTSAGAAISTPSAGGINQPFGLAIDAGGNAWFTNAFENTVSKLNSTGTSGSSFSVSGAGADLNTVAIDGAGNAWVASNDYDSGVVSDNAVFELSNTGTNLSGTAGYAAIASTLPDSLAIDGSGNVWYTAQAPPPASSATPGKLIELVGAAVPVATPLPYAVVNSMLGTRP